MVWFTEAARRGAGGAQQTSPYPLRKGEFFFVGNRSKNLPETDVPARYDMREGVSKRSLHHYTVNCIIIIGFR